MIGLAFLVGAYSLFHGYIKHHRSLTAVYIFSAGFIFLIMKQFFHPLENLFLIFAVPLIIGALFVITGFANGANVYHRIINTKAVIYYLQQKSITMGKTLFLFACIILFTATSFAQDKDEKAVRNLLTEQNKSMEQRRY